jgi:hypothetical protein
MRRRLALIVFFTAAHGVFTLACAMHAMAESSARFDNPERPHTFGATVAGAAASGLMLPGRLAWTDWASRNLPNSIEWLLFLANSAVWGVGGGALTTWLSGRRQGGRRGGARLTLW